MLRLALATLTASLLLAPSASAAVKASAALVRSGDAVRLEVKVTSSKAFTAATRPRSVKVGKLALSRASSARRAVVFRSAVLGDVTPLSGKSVSIKVKSRGATRTLRAKVTPAPAPPAAPAPNPAAPAPAAPAPPPAAAPPAPNAVRDDAAGQSAIAGGDLLLEWYAFGSTGLTADYRRIWMLSDGTFALNVVYWDTVMGEKCTSTFRGTWAFKEGWTSTEKGGLVLVKVTLTTAQGSGDEVLTFANADPNAVYIGGGNPVRYERNPQINNNCG